MAEIGLPGITDRVRQNMQLSLFSITSMSTEWSVYARMLPHCIFCYDVTLQRESSTQTILLPYHLKAEKRENPCGANIFSKRRE